MTHQAYEYTYSLRATLLYYITFITWYICGGTAAQLPPGLDKQQKMIFIFLMVFTSMITYLLRYVIPDGLQ